MAGIPIPRCVTKKRFLAVSMVIFVAFVLAIGLISLRDDAQIEQEQYSVHSAYLYDIAVLEKPLPVECRDEPQFSASEGVVDIRQYFASAATVLEFSRPSIWWDLPPEARAARWPTSVFSNFVVRNLSRSH
jgi:hypothetical protein